MDASVKREDESEDDSGHGIVYEMTSEDGFKAESGDLALLWRQVFEAVQEARLQHGLDLNPVNPMDRTGQQMVGLAHSALSFLLEQLPGAKSTEKYQFKYHSVRDEGRDEAPLKPNESGCSRSEMYKGRKPFDMFSWLASKYRPIPRLKITGNGSNGQPEVKLQQLSNRRITQLDLPMAMRFRHLAKSAKEAVDVFQSAIHGRGLYCKREIQVAFSIHFLTLLKLSFTVIWNHRDQLVEDCLTLRIITYKENVLSYFPVWRDGHRVRRRGDPRRVDGQAREVLRVTRHRLLHVQSGRRHCRRCHHERQRGSVHQSFV